MRGLVPDVEKDDQEKGSNQRWPPFWMVVSDCQFFPPFYGGRALVNSVPWDNSSAF
jgi:hypothetical protein